MTENGSVRHREHGYRIRVPEDPWRATARGGADLVYRGPGGAVMSLLSRCNRPVASPQIMARLLGLSAHRLRHAAPVAFRGSEGWTQSYDVREGERVVRVNTLTVVRAGCTYDFLLVAPERMPESERAFRAWWAGFEFTCDALPGEEPS